MSTTGTNAFMHRQPLADLNDELRELICTVRELDAQVTEENLTGDQLKEAFAELYHRLNYSTLKLILFLQCTRHYGAGRTSMVQH